MHPMPMDDEEDAPPGDDDAEVDKQLLQELQEWAAKGQAGDMRARLGKPMPGADDEPGQGDETDGAPAEDSEIPGVEAVPPDEAAAAGPDMEKLKAALARMRG